MVLLSENKRADLEKVVDILVSELYTVLGKIIWQRLPYVYRRTNTCDSWPWSEPQCTSDSDNRWKRSCWTNLAIVSEHEYYIVL